MVEELSLYTPQDLADLDALMHELSATSFCNEELLKNALNDVNVHVYVIRDEEHIVATGTLCIKHTSHRSHREHRYFFFEHGLHESTRIINKNIENPF